MNARSCCPAPACCRHARSRRVVIAEHGGWQVLIHPRNDAGYADRVGAGGLSLLLWHPQARVSVLVPSAESDFAYEVRAPHQPLARAQKYAAVTRLLAEQHGIAPLCSAALSRLYARFVLMALVGATAPATTRSR